jgi:hypothetical protein
MKWLFGRSWGYVSKLHFHHHVVYVHSQALKLLGLIHFITYNFSFLDSQEVLYITLICSKLEYMSVVWNNLTLADSNKLENILRKFAHLCYNRFMQPSSFCNYETMLNYLHFKMLFYRLQNFDTLFLINVFKNKIGWCSVMHTVGLCVPTKQIRDFSTFNVSNISRLSHSTRCITAANICKALDVFSKHNITLEDTFSFHIPTELHHCGVTYILFYCLGLNFSSCSSSFSSSLSLAFACTLSVLACYRPLAVGKYLNNEIELNWIELNNIKMVLRGRDYEDGSWIWLDNNKILWWNCVLKSQTSLSK